MNSTASRSMLLELLAESGSGFLAFRHIRRALASIGPCSTVLLLGAARSSLGLALAAEYPLVQVTIAVPRGERHHVAPLVATAHDRGVSNLKLMEIDLFSAPPSTATFELVIALDVLSGGVDEVDLANEIAGLASRYVFAIVPFYDPRAEREPSEPAGAAPTPKLRARGFGVGELLALFPRAAAIRGVGYREAGGALAERPLGSTEAVSSVDVDRLVALADADLRPGWPRSANDATALSVLARVDASATDARERSRARRTASRVPRRSSRGTPFGRLFGRLFGHVTPPAVRRDPAAVVPYEPRALIELSGMFDADFYRSRYPDIVAAKVEPLDHFIRHGAREGRSPSAEFDVRAYARAASIDLRDENPVLHFLRRPDVQLAHAAAAETSGVDARHESNDAWEACVDVNSVRVTIIVPVYDGGDHVRRAIEAVRSETRLAHAELLIIDDASTDARLAADLDRYALLDGVCLIRNDLNAGFTRTVNRGLALAVERGRDAVILNSDTRVGPGWLEALVLAAYRSPATATATALSDNAGAFSTPEVGENATLSKMSLARATRMSRRAAGTVGASTARVPTGNGFCMYIRRDALATVGLFDATHFPRGYGEENDFCRRAIELGYQNVIALRSYVHHVNAVSFGAEKASRVAAAREVLDTLHPDYTVAVRRGFADAAELRAQRTALASTKPTPCLPRVLFVVASQSAELPPVNADLMRGVSHLYQPLLLSCDGRTMRLVMGSSTPSAPLAEHQLVTPIAMLPHTSLEYDSVIGAWLEAFDVELVHVEHIAWHSLGLTRVARERGIRVVVSLHDFYCMCPSVNLTDGRGPWAKDGYANPTIVAPHWERTHVASYEQAKAMTPAAFFTLWRRRMNTMLAYADRYVTTSQAAKHILASALPVLRERDDAFLVIPSGRDSGEFVVAAVAPSTLEPLRVLVFGNLTAATRLETILRVVDLDTEGAIEIHTLGDVPSALLTHPRFINHGTYDRDTFVERVREMRPHVSLIVSVGPEAFCHTLTESWAVGVPVVGSNVGAVGERLAAVGGGVCVDLTSADEIFVLLNRLRASPEAWEHVMERVQDWQQGLGARETVRAMSARYVSLYADAFRAHQRFGDRVRRAEAGLRPRVAVVAKGAFPSAPPTVHVRIANVLARQSGRLEYAWVDAETIAAGAAWDYDAVLVCRDASSAPVLDSLVDACVEAGTPWFVDIDDDLLHVPADKDVLGAYVAAAPALRRVLGGATHVFVSTHDLADKLRAIAPAMSVAPNGLLSEQWLAPLKADIETHADVDAAATLRVLYAGSRTHKEDLDVIMPAVTRLATERGVVLHVVGVDREAREGTVRLSPPDDRYDAFVPWFRSVAAQCDVAVAPLVDSDFNRGKSNLKFLEYAAAGLPVVASDVGPYAATIRSEQDGLLVANDTDAWFEAIVRLLDDAPLRLALAARARARVEQEFMLTSCHFDAVLGAGIADFARRRSTRGARRDG